MKKHHSSMRTIDEGYWHEYYAAHNDARFVEFVDRFYHPNATFTNPKNEFRGRDALIQYFQTAGEFANLTLAPLEIWVKPGTTATEVAFTAEAKQDIPNFVTGPLNAGQTVQIQMAATYRMADDLIARASIFWGRRIE